jgi:poly-gamma-glutamate capsule biosynthesis protein CapA/YwtB (metallophosphatase superfamily)
MRLILFFILIVFLNSKCSNSSNSSVNVAPNTKTSKNATDKLTTLGDKDTLNLTFVGDIMMGTNYPAPGFMPPNSGKDLFAQVTKYLTPAHITFGNCEGTLFDAGGVPKSCANPAVCYAFRMPSALGQNLKDAGFDLISVANNHLGDFGAEGRKQTMANLEKLGMKYSGQETCPTTIIEANNFKLGMVAVAPNNACMKLNDYATIKANIQALKKTCNLVMVSFHGGAEGRDKTKVPRQHEIFFGEDRGNVYEMAHMAIDAGADMVIGHGPHVTRAFDYYKGKFIAYSLGNFCTWDRVSLAGISGIAPILNLSVTGTGKLAKASIVPIRQIGKGIPIYDDTKQVTKQLQELTKSNFPEAGLTINLDGSINFK